MGKWIKRIVLIVLVCVFVGSLGMIGYNLYLYRKDEITYEQTVNEFVTAQTVVSAAPDHGGSGTSSKAEEDPATQEEEHDIAPIVVDFDALHRVNTDVIGWIYCEGTIINYPVLQGVDNDQYLRHLYDGTYLRSGSIFMESKNSRDLTDMNTIIYGHNMGNDIMFGTLDSWAEQAFYEEHPYIWLLTPDQDYKIDILSTYTTSAYSDTYTVFFDPGPDFDAYLSDKLAKSEIVPHSQPEDGAQYVTLSTCSYLFSNARFVVHGKLVPAESAGGILKK